MNEKKIEKPTASAAVIVPCYNHGQYLSECLDSILNQTYRDWVCVIVDDGSTDSSRNVADAYCQKDSRFSYYYQQNRGLPGARNSGINRCASAYILPLDADDKLASTYLEKTVKVAEEYPCIKIVYSRCQYFGTLNHQMILPDYSYRDLLIRNLITATALFRRKDYNLTTGYDDKLRQGLEDWEFWLQLLDKESKVLKIDEPLFYYRQREKSMINSLSHQEKTDLSLYIFDKHIEKYRAECDDPIISAYYNKVLEIKKFGLRNKSIFSRAIRKIRRTLDHIRK
jgi:glycosyltransferase involved in cell wall biosynthesis